MPCIPETLNVPKVTRGVNQMLAVAGVANFKPGEVNPYDNEVLMPLKEFIERPEALDLLHDGQVLQVCAGQASALPMICLPFNTACQRCSAVLLLVCLPVRLLGCQVPAAPCTGHHLCSQAGAVARGVWPTAAQQHKPCCSP